MFPSMRASRLLVVLLREPLAYRVVRQRGSHRRLVSARGYPPLTCAFHDRVTLPPGVVRDILVEQVGLPVATALRLVRRGSRGS
jgi:predicted RNA binding protein YcfA (HicA-like mRNA interferase family)